MRRLKRLTGGVLVVASCAVLADVSPADDAKPERQAVAEQQTGEQKADDDKPTAIDARIKQWISQLNSRDFAERREASQSLFDAGRIAIEPIAAAAAASEDLERTARCIEILSKFFKQEKGETKTTAEAALKRLAAGENKSVAQRAAQAIKKPDPKPTNRGRIVIGNVNGNQIQLRAWFGGAALVNQRPKATGKTAELKTTPAGVTLKLTERNGAKKKVTEYKAKNLEELKKKHAAAYKVYEKFQADQKKRQAALANAPVIQIAGANRKIQFQGRTESIVNGKRDIRVTNNDEEIHITETEGKNIVLEITKPVSVEVVKKGADGKEVKTTVKEKRTKAYRAADVDELKKKHPEAAKIYEKHTQLKHVINLEIGIEK